MLCGTYTSLGVPGSAKQAALLPQVLTQLHRMDEKNSQMRSNIISALSYPAFFYSVFFSGGCFCAGGYFPQV